MQEISGEKLDEKFMVMMLEVEERYTTMTKHMKI
jgi:hypothetical protein